MDNSEVGLCAEQIPHSLKMRLRGSIPEYRLPRASDFSEKELKYLDRDKTGPCFSLTRGDFDGDGQQDLAFYLVKRSGQGLLLVAALRRWGWRWEVDRLWDQDPGELKFFVWTAKPGHYETGPLYEPPPQPGLVDEMTLKREGVEMRIEVGDVETESDGRVYGYADGGWEFIENE